MPGNTGVCAVASWWQCTAHAVASWWQCRSACSIRTVPYRTNPYQSKAAGVKGRGFLQPYQTAWRALTRVDRQGRALITALGVSALVSGRCLLRLVCMCACGVAYLDRVFSGLWEIRKVKRARAVIAAMGFQFIFGPNPRPWGCWVQRHGRCGFSHALWTLYPPTTA
jgi:hypothetical protein